MLCIHVRIWIFGFIAVGLIALFCTAWPSLIRGAHTLNTIIMIGFVERSWRVLAVERGWTFGDCDMNSGLPSWFALDQWFPALFEVKTACGYTPYIIFNISMAEVLMLISSVLLLLSITMFWASLQNEEMS